MTKPTRIRDIAAEAGVSPAAVSRALKGHGGLRNETRQRILTVARQQGYDFSRLRNEKIRRVLFLLHQQHNTTYALLFYSPLLLRVEKACRDEGIALSFLAIGPTDPLLERVSLHNPDALLCVGFFEPELLEVLKNMQLPLVLMDLWGSNVSSVNPDNIQGGYLATRHLLEQGRTRIAFLASSLAHFSIRQRELGYRKALYEANILVPPEFEAVAPPTTDIETSLVDVVNSMIDMEKRPDAIFAYNDAAALVAMRTCQERGLSIPQDIAFIGFDDIESARLAHPPLTTIAINQDALAQTAVQMLIHFSQEVENRTQPVTLIQRKSAGE